jgi:hypothetical protein
MSPPATTDTAIVIPKVNGIDMIENRTGIPAALMREIPRGSLKKSPYARGVMMNDEMKKRQKI